MIINKLSEIWADSNKPFFISEEKEIFFSEIHSINVEGIEKINAGDVVALIGDFNPKSILTFLKLIELKAIIVPITKDTITQHNYFLKESKAQYLFEENKLTKIIKKDKVEHNLLKKIRDKNHPGIILFTTGTTGSPKAILHDFIPFISRYDTPRPPLKALSFLLFDHIGGLNTLLHMLFNKGTIVAIKERTVNKVLKLAEKYSIELLPTTPTFLRLLCLYPDLRIKFPKSIKIISYGTERLDEITLKVLCKELPDVDFRQTYGMSELGILRIKSLARDSLFMKVGGEGVETKIINNILYIKAKNKMIGYLNSDSPFNKDGWYCTKDIVEKRDDNFLKIVGRDSDVINVGGLKFMPSEIELICLQFSNIKHVKAYGKANPITGQHVELIVEPLNDGFSKLELLNFLKLKLPKYMIPLKILIKEVSLSHRFKKI
tara:strand:+ start:2590 stop:3888 length:1299 start_codon:yes stop_codon:yes gene_type:complete